MILSQFHCLEVDAQHSSAVCILSLCVDGLVEKYIWLSISHCRFTGTLEKGQVWVQLQFSSRNLSTTVSTKSHIFDLQQKSHQTWHSYLCRMWAIYREYLSGIANSLFSHVCIFFFFFLFLNLGIANDNTTGWANICSFDRSLRGFWLWKQNVWIQWTLAPPVPPRSRQSMFLITPLQPTMYNSILSLDSGSGVARCSPLPYLNLLASSHRNTVS